jgi:predicted transcriptional regulator
MTDASNEWSKWAEKVIILEEGKKALFSKLFLKYKLDTKTIVEAEHKARTDPEYKTIIESYAHAESQLIKAKLMYNNLDRYISVRQTEVKRDLTLAGKQEG